MSGYGRFKPNKCDYHSRFRDYRGCWHRYCPPLIRRAFYTHQKPIQSIGTRDPPITLSGIVEVSRLLHPVGLGPLSQCPSPGYHFHGPYRS